MTKWRKVLQTSEGWNYYGVRKTQAGSEDGEFTVFATSDFDI